MAEDQRPLGPVDLTFLFALDRDVRARIVAALRTAFAIADAKADDYVLAGPGEGE